MKIQIINGPNLNLLGRREPSIYGDSSFERYLSTLRAQFPDVQIDYFQSNVEGELINQLQAVGPADPLFRSDGVVLNAGGYSHTSIALHDCIRAIAAPVIEVHISNLYQREAFRHQSMLSSVCQGVIVGLGLPGYGLAVEALVNRKRQAK